MSKRIVGIIVALATIALVAGLVVHSHKPLKSTGQSNSSPSSAQKYAHIDISIKDGKLVGAISTYLVNPGTGLEFSITSNKFGKIGSPTYPPQTITFTKSPLIFHFTTSKAGTFPMTYQADGSTNIIEIGIVIVRSTK